MKNLKIILVISILTAISFLIGWQSNNRFTLYFKTKTKEIIPQIKENPLTKYQFENLASSEIKPGKIVLDKILSEGEDFTSYHFILEFSPIPGKSEIKKTSGLINIPNNQNQSLNLPIIVMFRGYVDQNIYQTGTGTKRAGEYFSKNGFITIALDFLGYGESDNEAQNIFESRFQTYTTALSLLKTLELLPNHNEYLNIRDEIDQKDIILQKFISYSDLFLWGHSNGGQIALTILEITQKEYPTSLWAPVSKPFPYSILYYTDESEDRGKLIRSELSKFEEDYDVEKFSLDNYLGKIKAPIQIHQGSADNTVPVTWTQELCSKLKKLDIDTNCLYYQGADHNLSPSWNTVINRDLEFFQKQLSQS